MEDDEELLIRLVKVCRLLALAAEKNSHKEEAKRYNFEALKWARIVVEKCPNRCDA